MCMQQERHFQIRRPGGIFHEERGLCVIKMYLEFMIIRLERTRGIQNSVADPLVSLQRRRGRRTCCVIVIKIFYVYEILSCHEGMFPLWLQEGIKKMLKTEKDIAINRKDGPFQVDK